MVADRGMISQETIAELEDPTRGWQYILGARMRAQKEVREEVPRRAGRYQVVQPAREVAKDPSGAPAGEGGPGRRAALCGLPPRNEEEARKDAVDREAILA